MTICCIWMFIVEEAAKTVIALCTTVIFGGVGWLLTLHHRTTKLKQLLAHPGRLFILYFRGDEDNSKTKLLHFQPDGTIENPNHNEHFWKVRFGTLEIYTSGHVIYSKFRWDPKQGRLVHTNDPRLPSVMGQYIIPSYIPAASNPSIYCKE